jgi:radical SAM protein with 4Fe4S-binding SPASM domain
MKERDSLRAVDQRSRLKGRLIKDLNRALVGLEFRLRKIRVYGLPYILFVDTMNVCNLRCPLCPTGTGMKGRRKGKMERQVFERVLKELGPYARQMWLYNWGEPLLNPEIFDFVRQAARLGIRTKLSSNMNLFDEQMAEQMVRSGLGDLIISLDGVRAETYEAYRIGGNFERVKTNVRLLAKTKEALRSAQPRTILQFIVFKHNEHEVPAVKELAAELMVDDVEIFGGDIGGEGHTPYTGRAETRQLAEKWLSRNPEHRGYWDYFREDGYLNPSHCWFLWRAAIVNWDGSVSPCCNVYRESDDFANIMERPFRQIWNNTQFRSARALFAGRNGLQGTRTVCSTCKYFRSPSGSSFS